MDKRVLAGSVAALVVLLALNLLIVGLGRPTLLAYDTAAGSLPLLDIGAAFVAMAVGGAIAMRRFQWVAVAVSLALWVLTFAMIEPLGGESAPQTGVAQTLRYNGLAMLLTLAAAWAGAWVGERIAQRRPASPAFSGADA